MPAALGGRAPEIAGNREEAARENFARDPGFACGMRMPPRPLDAHPNPERPAVKVSIELVERVAANANALESFLNSIDFSILLKGYGKNKDWHESSLNRYKMFLYLKLANPSVWLVPTADIEFCWLAHIFRTRPFWKDMADLGSKPDHRLCLTLEKRQLFRKLWKPQRPSGRRLLVQSFLICPLEQTLLGMCGRR